MDESKKRILNLLKDGKITIDEAEQLLSALGASENRTETSEPTRDSVLKGAQGRKPSKLRVEVHASGMDDVKKANVNVSLPLKLAKTIFPIIKNNIPPSAQAELDKQNIDLAQIIGGIDEMIDNIEIGDDLVSVDADGGDDFESAKVRVYFE